MLEDAIDSGSRASSKQGALSIRNDYIIIDDDAALSSKFSNRSRRQARAHTDEDDEYWSDFSDNDYTQEVNEEKRAISTITSLQRWLYSSNFEGHLHEKYPNNTIITLDQFKRALTSSGFYCEHIDIQALLKRLDISQNTGIDYESFLSNAKDKNIAWWKQSIKNSSFDLAYKGNSEGNYRTL